MPRLTLFLVAAVCVACARGDDPTKLSAPNASNYTSSVGNPGEGGTLNSDDAYATATINHVLAKFRECQGSDGVYAESKNIFTGSSTGDPRLTGAFEFEMVRDLLNETKSNGPDVSRITIRDPSTGRVKAEGLYSSWGRENWLQGTVIGTVSDEGGGAEPTAGSGNWIANVRVEFTRDGPAIEIGGTGPPATPAAGISSGGCPGVKWTEIEFDVGPSAAAIAPAASGSSRRGLRM